MMKSQINRIHIDLLNGKYTCQEYIDTCYSGLKGSFNNTINSYLKDQALYLAQKVDAKIKNGEKINLLEGVPFGIKDLILFQESIASGSSNFLKNYNSPYTATVIKKLLANGAIPIVKENCDSFGHGSTNENSAFGPVKNALDNELVAGGSSGGSSVNVSKGHTVFSIGSDTGGSVRQPAGFNKVFGLKPTYGKVSRFGLMSYASSTDCLGPIASELEDIRILLNTIKGKDPKDLISYDSPDIPKTVFNRYSKQKIRVGYYKQFIQDKSIDASIKNDFFKLLETFEKNNVEIKELNFFDTDILVSVYYVIAMAETASNLARLDGIGFGNRYEEDTNRASYISSRTVNFSDENKRRIIGGNQVLSKGYDNKIYNKAIELRRLVNKQFNDDLETIDIILSPVSPTPPQKLGALLADPLAMYLSDAYTVGFSLAGLPALTVPVGTDTGIQIASRRNNEALLLYFGNYIETLL